MYTAEEAYTLDKKAPKTIWSNPNFEKHNKTRLFYYLLYSVAMSENENEVEDKSAKLFDKFIDVVKKRIQPDKQVSIPAFLRKKYGNAELKYTASKDFRNMILEHLKDMKKRKGQIYAHIHQVVGVLNAAKKKNGEINDKSNPEHKNIESGQNTGEGTSADEAKTKLQLKKEKKQKRRIKRLELHLKELSNEIKRLGERELTLDDMDDDESDHIMEHKLKLRFNRVWLKLCELKDLPPSTGRVTEQYLIFEGTRFKEINQKLEKLMNKKSEFPNFKDVLVIVRKVNKRKGLQLSDRELSDIAETSFKAIGNRLQQRREVDLAYNFGSHLTENFKFANDPAKSDPGLNRKLRENHKVGEEKLDKWIKECSEKQDIDEDYAAASSQDEPPAKRNKIDSSCESADESEKEEDEEEDNLDDELGRSDSEDDEESTTSSQVSSEVNTEDDQVLPDQSIFSHQKSVENDRGEQSETTLVARPSTRVAEPSTQVAGPSTQVASPHSSTDDHLDLEVPSPQEVTSSTSPKHLSEVMDWPKVATDASQEIIVLSSSDESTENSPVAKRINHMFGRVKDIALPDSSEEEECIVISD